MKQKLFLTALLTLTLCTSQMWAGTRRIYFDYSAVTWWSNDTKLNSGSGYVGCHAWNNSGSTDYQMYAVEGESNLAYCDINDSYTSLLFFRAPELDASKQWNQTDNWGTIGTSNRFKVRDFKGTEGEAKDKYLWAESGAGTRWAPGVTIDGLTDPNNPHNMTFTDGSCEVSLAAHSTYTFKIRKGTTAYGLDNNVWTGPITNPDYSLSSSGADIRLCTAGAGTYTFTWDDTNTKLEVSYPSVTHPTADYCYLFDHSWSQVYVYLSSSESGVAGSSHWGTRTYNRVQIGSDYYYYFAPGDYRDLMVSDESDNNKATGLTPSLGQYQKNINSSWGWRDFTFTVTLNTNGGTIHSGNVTSYTFGTGATLPTNMTNWGNNFAGWYDNSSLEGNPVTTIGTSESGEKAYWAKWTSIVDAMAVGDHPEFLVAQEGDLIVVRVSEVQPGAQIYLSNWGYEKIDNKNISSIGDYAFPLSSEAATAIRTNGLRVTGTNYTTSSVDILYRKAVWTGTLEDTSGWKTTELGHTIFAGIADGDYLGFSVSAINDASQTNQYAMQYNYEGFIVSADLSKADTTYLETVPNEGGEKLANGDLTVTLVSKYITQTALYRYLTTRDYIVELHNNGGRVWADSVGCYTFGVGAALPTNVTKWGCTFEGWYDNSSFEGEPVTTIGTSEYGRKDYYAKWTTITQEYPIASHSEFLAAQEGDIIVVNITSTQTSSSIYLYDLNYTEIEHRDISSTGKHVFQLSAAAAAGVRTKGLLVTGNNFTFDDVQIRYRKTLWSGPTISDNTGWTEDAVDKDIFSDISGGDYLGFNISAINAGNSYHIYRIRADYDEVLNGSLTKIGVGIHELSADQVTALQGAKNRIDIDAQYLDISNLYAYFDTRNYAVTLNTNGGTVNTGNITEYTYQIGTTLPDDITREDYTFGGWYDNSSFAGSAVTAISTSDYGDKAYWAKWTAIVEPESDQTWAEIFDGAEPTINDNIVLNSAHTITVGTGTTAYANQVTLKNDAKLVIEDGAALILRNGIDNNGSSLSDGDLTLGSSLENGNATLIYNVTTGLNATVEMASKATTTGGSWTWQYVGVPVAGVAENLYSNGYMYKWNNGWSPVAAKDNLEAFAGYCVTYSGAGHVFEMGGALTTTTSKTINVAAGKAQVIGNSWTAPIQIKQMDASDFNQVEQTIYLFNTGSDVDGTGDEAGSSDRYAAGTYQVLPISSVKSGAITYTTSISALQGFFVKNETKTDGSITLSYSKHVRPTGENSVINGPMHAPKRIIAEQEDQAAVAILTVSGTRYDDQLVLIENDNCSAGFDNGWDGEKIGESSVSPWIYALRADGTHDAVSATNDLEGTVIGFRAGTTDSQYTMHFDYSEEAEELYLYDVTEKQATRVLTDNTYTFTTTDKEEHARFTLLRANAPQIATGMENVQSDDVQCTKARKLMLDGQLYLMYKGTMYNVQGAVMK